MNDVAIIGVGLHPFGRFGANRHSLHQRVQHVRDVRFTADPAMLGLPAWYAENGQFVTTKFFGMKANRYAIDHNISHKTLARVAAKNYRNGGLNPNAFRRTEFNIDDILSSPMLNYPLTAKMFCAPDEAAAAVIMCRGDLVSKHTTETPVYLRSNAIRTRAYGAYEVRVTWASVEEDVSPTVYAAKAAFEGVGTSPEGVGIGPEGVEGATAIGGSLPANTDGWSHRQR
ncbi:hypothetical protein IM25_20280 [Rhodococcus sp. p52]|uniref:Thiolase n=1 Tax=Rhodococcus pyridinivorans AK37 TaxID=1114960 RepID=H0JXS7_9NOCA|nr:hypothetical protein IM25_20280 [Rhodococcus sp. p52]EHK80761.1 thiolase [Rhodococcus pyridinivorans AK37]